MPPKRKLRVNVPERRVALPAQNGDSGAVQTNGQARATAARPAAQQQNGKAPTNQHLEPTRAPAGVQTGAGAAELPRQPQDSPFHLYVMLSDFVFADREAWFISGELMEGDSSRGVQKARTEVQQTPSLEPRFSHSALHFVLQKDEMEPVDLFLTACAVVQSSTDKSVEPRGGCELSLNSLDFTDVPGSKTMRHATLLNVRLHSDTVGKPGAPRRTIGHCSVQFVISTQSSLSKLRQNNAKLNQGSTRSRTFASYVGASQEHGRRNPEAAFSLLSLDSIAPLAGTNGAGLNEHRRTLRAVLFDSTQRASSAGQSTVPQHHIDQLRSLALPEKLRLVISVHNGTSLHTKSGMADAFCSAKTVSDAKENRPARATTVAIPHTRNPVWAESVLLPMSPRPTEKTEGVFFSLIDARTSLYIASCVLPVEECMFGEQYNLGLIVEKEERGGALQAKQQSTPSYLFVSVRLEDSPMNRISTILSSHVLNSDAAKVSVKPDPLHSIFLRIQGFEGDVGIVSELFRRNKRSPNPPVGVGSVVCVAHVVADGQAYREHIFGTIESMMQKSLTSDGWEDTLPGLPFTSVPVNNQGALKGAMSRLSGFRVSFPCPLAPHHHTDQETMMMPLAWDEDFHFWIPESVLCSEGSAIALDFHYCEFDSDRPPTAARSALEMAGTNKRTYYAGLSVIFLEDLLANESHDGDLLAFQDVPVAFAHEPLPDNEQGLETHGLRVELAHWTAAGLVSHLLPSLPPQDVPLVQQACQAIGVRLSETAQESQVGDLGDLSARSGITRAFPFPGDEHGALREEISELREQLANQTQRTERAEQRERALVRQRDEDRKHLLAYKERIQQQNRNIVKLEQMVKSLTRGVQSGRRSNSIDIDVQSPMNVTLPPHNGAVRHNSLDATLPQQNGVRRNETASGGRVLKESFIRPNHTQHSTVFEGHVTMPRMSSQSRK